jgi:dTDP-4-amino-4,6-dideoxygalactose transaminase
MDMDAVEAAITPKTKAIVPVHYAGLPVDCDRLYEIAERHGIRVMEDAAHAIGASYKGRRIGSFGDTQVFSFHPNKNITTGEGGAISTRDERLARQIDLWRFHGIDREMWNRFSKTGSQLYDIALPGFKYNMTDIQAALGLHQLPRLDYFIEKRRQLVERYMRLIGDWPMFQFPKAPRYEHVHAWHLFTPCIIPEFAGMDRDTFIQEMKAEGIGLGLHWGAVHLSSYYQKKYGFKRGDFPHTEKICDTISSFPLFPDLTDAEQDRVVETMARILKVS